MAIYCIYTRIRGSAIIIIIIIISLASISYVISSQVCSYVDDCPAPPALFEELLNTYVATSKRTQKYTPKKQTILSILVVMDYDISFINLKIL